MRPAARASCKIWLQKARNIQDSEYPWIYIYTMNIHQALYHVYPCIFMDIPCIYSVPVDIHGISMDIPCIISISMDSDIHGHGTISMDITCIFHGLPSSKAGWSARGKPEPSLTKRVVDSERSAAAVIQVGLIKLRLSSCAAIADQYCISVFKFYCLFSCPRRPYRRAALQLGEAPSRLYIFGRLGSRAPRGPGRPGPQARQAVTPCTCRTSTLPLGAEFPRDPEVIRHGTTPASLALRPSTATLTFFIWNREPHYRNRVFSTYRFGTSTY